MTCNLLFRHFDGLSNGSINYHGHIQFERLRRDIRQFYCKCRENREGFANPNYISLSVHSANADVPTEVISTSTVSLISSI